ncbi:hypothetical protein Forpi1262_v002208 [Fusarium oxysporum f. sp. raphani]|uniref:Uncharacterized protein n=1 Tax=Fusarium oxysporum f. sp. raphani TaxID=96318 RepID=A0A8J5QCI5_FUSOX|nr:hypothetical protein Forpi1262_v002208 [Fusarium oxysporum f. sp. raphani]KAK2692939.1 hypothetical protein QWA68_007157 [Fusarium oxysporum]
MLTPRVISHHHHKSPGQPGLRSHGMKGHGAIIIHDDSAKPESSLDRSPVQTREPSESLDLCLKIFNLAHHYL